VADFTQVERLCTEALTARSKDLRIAAWLAEAWARTGGLDGATRGLQLFAALAERFWDTAFPSVEDEDGVETRASLVDWLDDLLASAVRRAPLGEPNQILLTYEDWERAERGLSHRRDGEDAQVISPESVMTRYSLIGAARWRAVRASAERAIVAAASVHDAFALKMERPPVLRKTRDILNGLLRIAREITGEHDMPAPEHADPPGAPDAAASPPRAEAPAASGPIKNRAEAYLRLSEAADYLLRTEPHSPVPYLIKRAVGWGNMSLAELLMELVGTPDDLVAIQRLLGMRGRE
jgi:type VI secretion system protein ImpA